MNLRSALPLPALQLIPLLILQLTLGTGAAQAASVAYVGGTIIDGNGGPVIDDGVIVIDGERITAVGGHSTPIPAKARKVDVRTKYIVPGLMDANVHLLIDVNLENLVRYEGRYADLIIEGAQVALKNGLTTVFESWGPLEALKDVRDRINKGEVAGSRLYVAGNIVGLGGPISTDFKADAAKVASKNLVDKINAQWEQGMGRRLLWLPAEQVGAEVRAYTGKGIDFLKYAVSGHSFGEMPFLFFSDAAQRAIVEETHRAGLTVQTHTSSVESFRMALEAGVDLMQHCETTGAVPLPDNLVQMLVDKKIPCGVLAQTEHRLEWYRSLGKDTPSAEFFSVVHPVKDQNVRNFIKAGAILLLATDAGLMHADAASDPQAKRLAGDNKDVLTQLGSGHFTWLRAMEEKGMDRMAILKAATSNIARAYKVDKDLGTIEKGKVADLLVLNRDPLQSAASYSAIYQVVKAGKVVDRQALPVHPILTAQTK